jgi:hypothetical protein
MSRGSTNRHDGAVPMSGMKIQHLPAASQSPFPGSRSDTATGTTAWAARMSLVILKPLAELEL